MLSRLFIRLFAILAFLNVEMALAFTSNVFSRCNENSEICFFEPTETGFRDDYGFSSQTTGDEFVFYFNNQPQYRGEKAIVRWRNNEVTYLINVSPEGYVLINQNKDTRYSVNLTVRNVYPEIYQEWTSLNDTKKRSIQSILKQLGFYTGQIDGLFGAGTYSAILGYHAIFNQKIETNYSRYAAGALLLQISRHTRFDYKNSRLDIRSDMAIYSNQTVCGIATENSFTTWTARSDLAHWVAEAKRRNLDCGVGGASNSGSAENMNTCASNPRSCNDSSICILATRTNSQGVRTWQSAPYENIVQEAKRRGLTCGISTASVSINGNTCANDPTKCGAVELCVRGSELKNGERVWRTDANGKTYAEAARSIGLSCNVISEIEDEVFRVANGTGFFVTTEGHVVTNQHVIDGCNEIQVHTGGQITPATVVSQDSINDLALLKTSQVPKGVFLLAENNPQLLDDIIAAGFPFGESVSSSVKVTKGIVSSLSGLGDNSGQIQIDAALQPGNSGGPIVNLQGHVVGVAVAKLDVEKSIESFGAIPENVNFGIKLSSLKTFLDDNNVDYDLGSDRGLQNAQLGRQISDSTVLLSCWMNEARIQLMTNQRALFSSRN